MYNASSYQMRGVALVQVLIMTAIMSLIAVQFSKTAREQVATAMAYSERVKTQLLLRSAVSQIYFNFFKYDPQDLSDKTINGAKWNLRGQPFNLNKEVSVEIQAASGKLSPITTPESLWLKVLAHLGVSGAAQLGVYQSISDWVDPDDIAQPYGAENAYYRVQSIAGPRNGPMQDISELSYVKGIDTQLYQKLAPLVTTYNVNSFNPGLAKPSLVRALFSPDVANQLIAAQQEGSFSAEKWQSIVGSRSYEFIDAHPGNTFSVKVTAQVGKIKLTNQFDIRVQSQKAAEPIITLASY